MNYEEDMYIDESALDIEWLEQASLALRYGKHFAVMSDKLTRAEEKIKLVRAELIKEAHSDPVRCLGKNVKITADTVEAYYRTHERHEAAKKEWITAQFEARIAEIAKNEISYTRKAALENLVKLHGQQYFVGPIVPHNLTEQREMKSKEISRRIKTKMTRTNGDKKE